MSRVRADDYEDKRQGILDAAAVLFAQSGYANVKMVDIAKACGASKSMLYHYFPKKEDVLFEIMKEQVQSYLEATEEVAAISVPPEERLREFVTMWLRKATQARARITVLMYEVKFLPRRQRNVVNDVARRLIDRVAEIVAQVNPALKQTPVAPRHRTYTLLLFGLLNWTEVWFRSTGPLGADEMADMIYRLFLHGLPAAAPAGKLRAGKA
jgi:AcrR family transcriptional regulator